MLHQTEPCKSHKGSGCVAGGKVGATTCADTPCLGAVALNFNLLESEYCFALRV